MNLPGWTVQDRGCVLQPNSKIEENEMIIALAKNGEKKRSGKVNLSERSTQVHLRSKAEVDVRFHFETTPYVYLFFLNNNKKPRL